MPISGSSLTLTTLFGALFLVYGIAVILDRGKTLEHIPGFFFLVFLLALSLFSTVYSIAPVQTLSEWTKILSAILAFILGYLFVKGKKLTYLQIFQALAVSAVFPVFFGFFQFFTKSGMNTFNISNRLFGTFAHPNVFAFFLLFLFLAGAYAYAEQKKPSKLFEISFAISTTVIIALLAGTYTRAAWIGLVLFLVVLTYFYSKIIFFTGVFGLAIFILFFIPIISTVDNIFHTQFEKNPLVSRIIHRDPNADSLSWRGQVLHDSIPLLMKRPIFGYGYGTFPTVWEQNRPPERAEDDSAEAHNDYLRLAIETGVFGIILYLSFLFSLFWFAIKKAKKHRQKLSLPIFCSTIAVFIVVSMSDNMLHHTPVMWLLWSYWGAALATL
jgi:O-antigen ligase